MVTLALDTSAAAGSAALLRDGTTLVARAGDGSRTHGERLPRELMTLLEEARLALRDVDLLAVCTGPGSFTGLRVGIAAIQGLAMANDLNVVPVSAFDAFAWMARDRKAPVAIWIDAHRGEVFATLRGVDGAVLAPPSSRPPADTLAAWRQALPAVAEAPMLFVGDGAARYRGQIEEALGPGALVTDERPLLAEAVGEVAAAFPDRAVRPHAVAPMYVRRPDAELARDRRRFD